MSQLLSIVVPVRNMTGKLQHLESWITDAIEFNVEVIIVEDIDDPSTTIELEKLVSRFGSDKIKKVSGKYGSPGGARNAGKILSKGKWITFWDSDDIGIPKVVISYLLDNEKNETAQVLVFSFRTHDWIVDSQVTENLVNPDLHTFDQIAKNPGIWRIVFSTEFLKDLEFPDYKMAEDQVFLARVGLRKPEISYVSEVGYLYYRNVPNQLTSSREAITDLKRSTQEMSEICDASGQNTFNFELYIRQSITGMLHGKFIEKPAFFIGIVKFLLHKFTLTKIAVIVRITRS